MALSLTGFPDVDTFKTPLESSCASRGALVRQVVPRLSTGLALASDECVWNGDVGRGENGELGPLLTTVESERRRRIVLLLLLSAPARLAED